MKQVLMVAVASLSLTAAAFAQTPTAATSPGPHDPNPPMATPDLQLPPPCAPAANLAAAGMAANPEALRRVAPRPGQVMPIEDGTSQCATNGVTQSATLPDPRGAP